jgi:hypothetical protein
MPRHQYAIVACARWEEDNILEWLEYHKGVGFDHVYLYSNDDDPTSLFRTVFPYVLGNDPFVTFTHWPKAGDQVAIFLDFLDRYAKDVGWFSFLDIDEFFVFKDTDNVEIFMQSYKNIADCVYFHWMIFGHSGKIKRDECWTLTSYLRRARYADVHTKMICRSASVDPDAVRTGSRMGMGSFWHFLDNYMLPNVRCIDVLKHPMNGYSADFPKTAYPFVSRPGFTDRILERGYIAHFQFRSEEDFIRRWRRGGFTNDGDWRRLYESGGHRSLLDARNAVYDSYLASFWHRHTTRAMRFAASPVGLQDSLRNVALNKPSWQSSVYEDATVNPLTHRMVGGGNNGVRTGGYGFHTQHEAQPWWMVDLLTPHHITEIHIFNRRDPATAIRANTLEVFASSDMGNWVKLFSRTDPSPFGLDGAPLIVRNTFSDRPFRFVRLHLRDSSLHLDEVEVYGQPMDEFDITGKDWCVLRDVVHSALTSSYKMQPTLSVRLGIAGKIYE